MFKTILSAVIIFIIFTSCEDVKQKSSSEPDKVSETLDKLITENNIPGINFSVIYNNGEQENFSGGFSDLENKVTMKPDHLMFSGSVGKTYCVAVIMQLYDEGRINLKDRIIDYFPDSTWLNRVPNMKEITIEMCLQHTTGLPRYAFDPAVWDTLYMNPDKVWSYKDRFYFVFDDEAIHEAGKGWGYSDTNYILLGMLIEKLTGMYYYEVVANRVMLPYQLKNTIAADRRDIENLATGYSQLPEEFNIPNKVVVDGKYIFNPQMEWTGGGFASTTSDLAKWANLYYENFPFPDSIRQKIITPNSNSLLAKDGDPYGTGSFIFQTKHGRAFGHTGFFPGYNSIFAYYPKNGLSVALQINCDYATEKINLVSYLDQILKSIEKD